MAINRTQMQLRPVLLVRPMIAISCCVRASYPSVGNFKELEM